MPIANCLNANLLGFQSIDSNGIMHGVTLTGTSNQITVTNGNGTAGNPTLALTSTIYISGISFDSGSDSMQNYSTGTFSPQISNQTTAPTGVTYSYQVGTYTRIGNRVFINCNVALATYTAGTGPASVPNLPFTSNSSGTEVVVSLQVQNTANPNSSLWTTAEWQANGTFSIFRGYRSTMLQTTISAANVSASTIFQFSLTGQI